MASNAFRASQLIAHLQALMVHHGDCDLVVVDKASDRVFALTEKDVVASTGLPGKALPGIVFAIGPRDPAADYQWTADAPGSIWNTDLGAAPANTRVKVNKRFGGEDEGYRDEADVWFVYEHGPRAWAVAPGGILAWRLP